MKNIIILLTAILLHIVSFAQNLTPVDKYEHMAYSTTLKRIDTGPVGSAPCAVTGGNKVLEQQLIDEIAHLGEAGWELVANPEILETKIDPGPGWGCVGRRWVVICYLKRKTYSTKQEIEKQVADYSNASEARLREALMTEINKKTWVEMGTNYKQEIVDEIMQQMSKMLEENNNELIKKLKTQ